MLWLCGLLHGCTHVYHVALLPLYLLIKKDLGLANLDLATSLVTLFGLAYFIPSYGIGILADHFNRKHLLTLGLIINGAGFIALSLAPNYNWAVASVVLAGIGGSFYHPCATALIVRMFPFRAGKALGWVGLGAGLGFFLSPIYTGWRGEIAGWRAPVLEMGLFGIAAALVFAWLAVDNPGNTAEAQIASKDSDFGSKQGFSPSIALVGLFLLACLAFSLRDFAGNGMGSLSSIFLQKAHGFNQRETGLAISAIFLAAIISNPLFGRLSDRGRFRYIALALLVATGVILSFPWISEAWLIPAFFAYGFFFMASYPMVEAALMESVPDRIRGRVFGLFITIGGLIGTLAHWITGLWVKALEPKTTEPAHFLVIFVTFGSFVALSLVGLPCLHLIRKQLRKSPYES